PQVAGVTHREVDLGDVRLHVAEAGQGPPLLLLHGWPQHWWSWRHLIPRLAETHRVIACDLRGWGWSSAPPGDYAKRTFARDVVAFLDAEGLDRVTLMGHDWGGYTAFLVALDHPARVERLVALDIAPPWPGRPRPRHLALPAFASYQVLVGTPVLGPRTMTSGPRFVRTLIRAGSGPDARWTDAELDVYADVLRDPARAEASSACYRTFLTRELPAALRRGSRAEELTVPSLLLMGGASALRRVVDPQPSRNLRVQTIPRAGHFLPEEAPEEVLRIALPFLAER
ncbi:MAG: alpha/beta hydrolase fold protein, partial [Conexibacter sp.]|nr:alpha/beta hydrolase fold protein [Conexibacter sp.]